MKHFTIDNETNNITLHASVQEGEAAENAERFRSEDQLSKIAIDWPMTRLVEIWNSLPGATRVNKFRDRATAVNRIWKAIQILGESEPETSGSEAATAGAGQAAEATTIVPHSAGAAFNGASAPPVEGAVETAQVDKEKCIGLLRIAALAQSHFWDVVQTLEGAIGFDVDMARDLNEVAVDDLIEQHQSNQKRETSTRAPRENSKTTQVIEMLKRPEGTTVEAHGRHGLAKAYDPRTAQRGRLAG